MYRRRPSPEPRPARAPAALGMLTAEGFHDLPFGGHAGEWIGHSPAEPAPPIPEPLRLEPPPWQAELEAGELDLAALAPPAPSDGLTALDALRLAGDDIDWPSPQGPPVQDPPLVRPQLPEPDWRGEHEAHAKLMREIADEGT